MPANQPNFRPMGNPAAGAKPRPASQSGGSKPAAGLNYNAQTGAFDIFGFLSPNQEAEAIRQSVEKTGAKLTGGPISNLRTKPLHMPRHTFLILWMQRPGAAGFLVETEHTLFPPATAKNDLFQMAIVPWSEMRWHVLWFPVEYHEKVKAIAEKWGLRYTLSRSIPRQYDPKAERVSSVFPLVDSDNVFTVESQNGMDRTHDLRFAEVHDDLYTTWAKQLPFHRVDVFVSSDAAIQRHPCPICGEPFHPGDAVALLGEDPARNLDARVHAEHIADVLPVPDGEFDPARSRDEHLQWARRRAHYAINQGKQRDAFEGFAADLYRHPETADHPALVEGYLSFLSGEMDDPNVMRTFLEVVE